jgi:hypothetical protein
VEEAHVESRRAGHLDPDHLLGPPLLPDLLHDLPRDAGATHLGPRLDPHRGVPQPPELGGGQRQLGHPRRRPRSQWRGLGRRHGSLPGEPRVPERRLRVVVEPAACVGQNAVVGAEHVLHGAPRRAKRRGGGRGLLGGVPRALEAAEDEGHGGAAGGAAGADGILVV